MITDGPSNGGWWKKKKAIGLRFIPLNCSLTINIVMGKNELIKTFH
jgi:hypothetical protein